MLAFTPNDKIAPEGPQDLIAIQSALIGALPKAKAATVCIDLGEGTGSGVIVSEQGLVMTAAHVSTAVGKEVTVIMPDGLRLKAETLGLMAEVDAALVQITEPLETGAAFPTVEIKTKNDTELGDWVFALGHSGGFDKERGINTRLSRIVRIANNTIQTDGSLIGGDSGGPLFDMEGSLVAIHSRVGPQIPVNMHVPVKVFLKKWDEMLSSKFIGEGPFASRPTKGSGFLGIATKDGDEGLEVTKVGKKSPAMTAGILLGDFLQEFNGELLETRADLRKLLAERSEGDKVHLEVLRDGDTMHFELRLGKR